MIRFFTLPAYLAVSIWVSLQKEGSGLGGSQGPGAFAEVLQEKSEDHRSTVKLSECCN